MDHLVNQPARLHAAQRQQPVGPGIGGLAYELRHGVGARYARLAAQRQVRVHHLPRGAVGRGQMGELIGRQRLALAPDPQARQPLLQVAAVPGAARVVPAFQQVAQLQAQRLEDLLEVRIHA